MSKKYTTTLSSKELDVVEGLLADHGKVVDFNMISKVFGEDKGRQEIKNFIFRLTEKGWLIRLKRGLFVVSDISSRGVADLNQATIAQLIDDTAYVSFEASLQYHNLFDQYLKTITSVTNKRAHLKKFSDYNFRYIKVKKGLFGDFKKHSIDGQLVRVASKEKAIMDFLVYRRTAHNVDLIIEKLRDNLDDFDIDKLITISKGCSITVRRSLGVVLDKLDIDSSVLHETVKGNRNHSFLTRGSKQFNSKWRIYIDGNLNL